MKRSAVLSATEMAAAYRTFFREGGRVRIAKANVPTNLHPLLPYAKFWGLEDDSQRDALVEKAPKLVRKNLVAVVDRFASELNAWLGDAEMVNGDPPDEYFAFSALRMAADYAEAMDA